MRKAAFCRASRCSMVSRNLSPRSSTSPCGKTGRGGGSCQAAAWRCVRPAGHETAPMMGAPNHQSTSTDFRLSGACLEILAACKRHHWGAGRRRRCQHLPQNLRSLRWAGGQGCRLRGGLAPGNDSCMCELCAVPKQAKQKRTRFEGNSAGNGLAFPNLLQAQRAALQVHHGYGVDAALIVCRCRWAARPPVSAGANVQAPKCVERLRNQARPRPCPRTCQAGPHRQQLAAGQRLVRHRRQGEDVS